MERHHIYLLLFSVILAVAEGAWFQTTVPVKTINYVSSAFSSPKVCVMVGYNNFFGAIVRTADSGFGWTVVSNGVSRMTDISTITISSVAYFVAVSFGGSVYLSSNGGSNFTVVATLPSDLFGVNIGSNNNAYAVGLIPGSTAVSKVYSSSFDGSGYKDWADVSPQGVKVNVMKYLILSGRRNERWSVQIYLA